MNGNQVVMRFGIVHVTTQRSRVQKSNYHLWLCLGNLMIKKNIYILRDDCYLSNFIMLINKIYLNLLLKLVIRIICLIYHTHLITQNHCRTVKKTVKTIKKEYFKRNKMMKSIASFYL